MTGCKFNQVRQQRTKVQRQRSYHVALNTPRLTPDPTATPTVQKQKQWADIRVVGEQPDSVERQSAVLQ